MRVAATRIPTITTEPIPEVHLVPQIHASKRMMMIFAATVVVVEAALAIIELELGAEEEVMVVDAGKMTLLRILMVPEMEVSGR
jgi:hypothetical protein